MIKIVILSCIFTDNILTYVVYDATMSYDIMTHTTIYLCIFILLINLPEHFILVMLIVIHLFLLPGKLQLNCYIYLPEIIIQQ
jgi:hypothetical protein